MSLIVPVVLMLVLKAIPLFIWGVVVLSLFSLYTSPAKPPAPPGWMIVWWVASLGTALPMLVVDEMFAWILAALALGLTALAVHAAASVHGAWCIAVGGVNTAAVALLAYARLG